MRTLRMIAMLGATSLIVACTGQTAPDNSAPETLPANLADAPINSFADTNEEAVTSVDVRRVNVVVPRSLEVSEANRYYPGADIVWREDLIGDRHEQVKTIFEAAMARGTKDIDGKVPVVVDIEVKRFHALTEKARYTIGGVHSIRFGVLVRHAGTGEVLRTPRIVEADLVAYGGQQAKDAEAKGQTQKVRITAHLAEVIKRELTQPQGHENARLGVFQAINNL